MKKFWRVWAKALGDKSGNPTRKQTPLQLSVLLFSHN